MVFKADHVSEMYIYPTKLAKILKDRKHVTNLRSLKTKKLNKNTPDGKIQFVNQTFSWKNNKDDKEFLMQLINP